MSLPLDTIGNGLAGAWALWVLVSMVRSAWSWKRGDWALLASDLAEWVRIGIYLGVGLLAFSLLVSGFFTKFGGYGFFPAAFLLYVVYTAGRANPLPMGRLAFERRIARAIARFNKWAFRSDHTELSDLDVERMAEFRQFLRAANASQIELMMETIRETGAPLHGGAFLETARGRAAYRGARELARKGLLNDWVRQLEKCVGVTPLEAVQLRRELEKDGLAPSQKVLDTALDLLASIGRPVGLSELSASLGIDERHACDLLASLNEDGIVTTTAGGWILTEGSVTRIADGWTLPY